MPIAVPFSYLNTPWPIEKIQRDKKFLLNRKDLHNSQLTTALSLSLKVFAKSKFFQTRNLSGTKIIVSNFSDRIGHKHNRSFHLLLLFINIWRRPQLHVLPFHLKEMKGFELDNLGYNDFSFRPGNTPHIFLSQLEDLLETKYIDLKSSLGLFCDILSSYAQ